jgi:site-specific recombinase XerD
MSVQLGQIIFSFFEDHLKCQKGLQPLSLKSYRDAICLLLRFVAKDTNHNITRLTTAELTSERVRRFLNYLEQGRGNQVQTRNQRKAAVRTFFDYLASRDPLMLAEAQHIAAIPVKRTSPPETLYLDRDEIEALFAALPDSGPRALRDHVLLLFLYNTGARVQEVADLRRSNLQLDAEPRAHLHGKGDKWRTCPLWLQTAELLQQLLTQNGHLCSPEDAVFLARGGSPLTRFGIYKIVRRRTAQLQKKKADGSICRISPHVFRHTTAVHLLEAGVEVNVIRAWLGHVSLETTNRYAEISLRMKMDALRTCEAELNTPVVHHQKCKWRDDSELMEWLQSL